MLKRTSAEDWGLNRARDVIFWIILGSITNNNLNWYVMSCLHSKEASDEKELLCDPWGDVQCNTRSSSFGLFTNVSRRKSGRVQNLTLEVPLNREQARRGGRATIMVPSRLVCPTCGGYGEIGFYACHRCAGEGVVSGEVPISVTFPPGLLKDHSVVIPLDRFGIRNLYFTVLFRPMEVDCVGFSGYCIKHR